MRLRLSSCFAATIVALAAVGGQAQRTIVASSGAPAMVLDARTGPPDRSDPIITKVGMDSGKVPGFDERWSVFQFVLSAADHFDAIEVFFFEREGQIPTGYGWKVYADDGGRPGTVLAQGGGSYASLLAQSTPRTFANTFEAARAGTILFDTELDLPAGRYWATVYGTDGNIPQYVGSPGGSKQNFAWRKTTAGSDYSPFETKMFCMPSFGADITAGYSRLGPSAPYDYSGWTANEQQGRDLYHICFALVDTSGFDGTVVTGCIQVPSWPEPPVYTLPGSTANPQAFDIVFVDPVTEETQIVETVNLSLDGRFTTSKVRNGTYLVRVYPRHWVIGRFSCSDGVNTYQQPYVAGMGHPFVPADLGLVTLTGGTRDLGDIVLRNGDTDLDCTIGISDLNTAVIHWGQTIFGDCPPLWETYVVARDCNGDGVLGVQDMSTILVNFAQTGPSR